MDLTILQQRRNEDKTFALLIFLREPFKEVRQEILRREALPSYEEVRGMIQRAETSMRLEEENWTPMEAFGFKATMEEQRPKIVCPHCKRIGDTKERCWDLHPNLKSNGVRPDQKRSELPYKGIKLQTKLKCI